MSPAITIRLMTGHDVAPLAAVLGWTTYVVARRWSETLAGNRDMLVAEVEGQPAGSVALNDRGELPRFVVLFDLVVAEPLRSRGIGTRLIERVEAEARGQGSAGVYLEVSTQNADARRLYERLGYELYGPPFESRYFRYHESGEREEVVDTRVRLVKHFDAD